MMSYMYDQKKRSPYQSKKTEEKKEINPYKSITIPLSQYFNDPIELYLPEKKAYQYAKDLLGAKNHQMRKVLDGIKEAKAYVDANEFAIAKKTVFVLVAMSAYNAGRDPKLKRLYYFVESVINEKSIVSKKDIITLDELFTSIIAYHKQLGGSKNA